MKYTNQLTKGVAALAFVWGLSSLQAQQVFPSSDDAIKALKTAVQAQDRAALREIFGPEFDKLSTGDKTEDTEHRAKFAAAMAESCKPVPEGDDRITLQIGTNEWPMPIPLVKSDGQWHFDTEAGKDEIITRHIGEDELNAIGVCRGYVKAQQQYSSMNAGPNGTYSVKFLSTPGHRDGLYWTAENNAPASPFGPLVAQALSDGNSDNNGTGPQPFHGYFFRILTRQGSAAPGGRKDYMSQGMLATGFALVAYPEHWDRSGIMTFIVNKDGKVYERNLGAKTAREARKMRSYNPDGNWTLVDEDGIANACSEK